MKQKVIYWVCTAPVALLSLMAAAGLLSRQPQNMEGMAHLGYPIYFATILGVAKLLGGLALLYSPLRVLREWAYAGFTFLFLGAAYSHVGAGDEPAKVVMPFVMLGLLFVSRYFWQKGMGLGSKA